jgi:hypothetical protein
VRKAAFLRGVRTRSTLAGRTDGVRTGALTEQVAQAAPRRRPLRTLQQIPFDRNVLGQVSGSLPSVHKTISFQSKTLTVPSPISRGYVRHRTRKEPFIA